MWLLSHPTMSESNLEFFFFHVSYRIESVLFSWPLKHDLWQPQVQGFVLISLPLFCHVYFLKWFADSNSCLTAPLWVSMATTAWESTAACLRALQTIPLWRHSTHFISVSWLGWHGWVLTLAGVYITSMTSLALCDVETSTYWKIWQD